MDNPAKTPIARHQNVAQHISSKKPLSRDERTVIFCDPDPVLNF